MRGHLQVVHEQPEDDHYQAPKHVVTSSVENTLYSTNKYSCVRPVHTLYISYFIEHNGDDEPNNWYWMVVRKLRGYWTLKEEALDRTVWRTGFGRGCGPVVRLGNE